MRGMLVLNDMLTSVLAPWACTREVRVDVEIVSYLGRLDVNLRLTRAHSHLLE